MVVLERAPVLLGERTDDIVATMSREMGATLPWCGFNVHVAKGMLVEAAAKAYAAVGEVIPSDVPGLTALGVRQPVGGVVVVVGIAPWNAPLILGVRSIVWPLVWGNTVVLESSEQTPLTQAAIVQVLHDAGVPAGAVNLISNAPEDGPSVVEALIAHRAVTRVNFTGSSRVGRIIGELGGRHLTRVVLELGGKAPFLVLPDADLEEAAGFGAFMNRGELRPSARRGERHGPRTPARQRPPSGSTESWRSSSGPSDEAPVPGISTPPRSQQCRRPTTTATRYGGSSRTGRCGAMPGTGAASPRSGIRATAG
ncbi:aldehyde dehydrogenase family protein [Streptomyces canus]